MLFKTELIFSLIEKFVEKLFVKIAKMCTQLTTKFDIKATFSKKLYCTVFRTTVKFNYFIKGFPYLIRTVSS